MNQLTIQLKNNESVSGSVPLLKEFSLTAWMKIDFCNFYHEQKNTTSILLGRDPKQSDPNEIINRIPECHVIYELIVPSA